VYTERILQTKVNKEGVIFVGLMKDGTQHQRGLALLVAQEFLPRKANFDTPINLNGDRTDNAVENLMWRPRWHAVAYVKQFSDPFPNPITDPIRDKESRKTYAGSWDCAMANGLLEKDVVLSILNRTYSWPTYQEFEVVG